ncbi:hypothetical protein SAMN02982927_03555 [Sporolactobacillus nakayamae]|uniref:Uncharacterized protein n=1 Tax=Sporolactobacillus nakayamae TaxID=269670 RepID=A0A1I2WH24_9BACL|nr:hypothetical protein SAMN02982927_03555 [Sporolactobacillus nakayamae]
MRYIVLTLPVIAHIMITQTGNNNAAIHTKLSNIFLNQTINLVSDYLTLQHVYDS